MTTLVDVLKLACMMEDILCSKTQLQLELHRPQAKAQPFCTPRDFDVDIQLSQAEAVRALRAASGVRRSHLVISHLLLSY